MIEIFLIVAILAVLMHKIYMRSSQFIMPMEVRQNSQGLNPRNVTIGPFIVPRGYKVDKIVLDALYTVTCAPATGAGETFQGVVKSGFVIAGKRKILKFQRNTLVPLVTTLAATAEETPQTLDTITNLYSDAQPTTAVQEHSFYTFVGPFQPGKYYIHLKFHTPATEFTTNAVTAWTNDMGAAFFISPLQPGDTFITAEAEEKYAALQLDLKKVNGYGIWCTVANINNQKIDNNALSTTAWEAMRRAWIERFNTAWSGALRANDIGATFHKPRTFGVTFNAATNLQWVAVKKAGGARSRFRKVFKKFGYQRPKYPWELETSEESAEDTAASEPFADNEYELQDEYELTEVDPSIVKDAWEDFDPEADDDDEEDVF